MPNITAKIKDIRELVEQADGLLDEMFVSKARESLNEVLKELGSLAYDASSLRTRIKIAGRNLTEAFEQLMEQSNQGEL